MYFSKISAVALMSTAAVWASPVLDTRQNGLSCQTSSDSPDTTDVTSVINQVRGQGGICRQGNSQASKCTALVSHSSAAIAVCGEVDTTDTKLTCAEVADFANQIQQACRGEASTAGGTYAISAAKNVGVIHS